MQFPSLYQWVWRITDSEKTKIKANILITIQYFNYQPDKYFFKRQQNLVGTVNHTEDCKQQLVLFYLITPASPDHGRFILFRSEYHHLSMLRPLFLYIFPRPTCMLYIFCVWNSPSPMGNSPFPITQFAVLNSNMYILFI